jgi:hypothetical protein
LGGNYCHRQLKEKVGILLIKHQSTSLLEMSNYNGRRGPNVSQYLRDLNAINRQEPAPEEPFTMEEDLALFTNTQFFDFETGQNTDYQAQPVKADAETSQSASPSEDMTPAQSVMGELSGLEFMPGESIIYVVLERKSKQRFLFCSLRSFDISRDIDSQGPWLG